MEQALPASPDLSLTALLECATTVLNHPVAPGDHFLDLDGDSLTALKLVALLGARGFQLDVGEVFEQPDMASLARQLVVGAAEK